MSAIVSPILPRIRATGADALLREGRLVVTQASQVPAALLEEARVRRDDLRAELATLANDNPLPNLFDDAVERAAIQAEGNPVRWERKRPVSWARTEDHLAPGDYCGCCAGLLWWTHTDPPRGWNCCGCNPPAHSQAGQFRVVAT